MNTYQDTSKGIGSNAIGISLPTPVNNPQIHQELLEMEGAIDELMKAVENIAVRLAPATRESQPARENDAKAHAPLVPLANLIRSKREQIRHATSLLMDLVQRLEL